MSSVRSTIQANARQAPADQSIDFTDGLMVAAIALQTFWAVDPFVVYLWRYSLLRHLPTFLAIGAAVLGIAGRLIYRKNAGYGTLQVTRTYLGLLLFAVFVLSGSLYAKYASHIDSTFLLMGTSLVLGGPVTLYLIMTSSAPLAFVRGITIAIVGISLLSVAVNTVQLASNFHGIEHVVLVAVALPLLIGRRPIVRLAGAVLLVVSTAVSNKFTGYIVMLIVFAWVYVDEIMIWTTRDPNQINAGLRRTMSWLLGLFAAMAVVAIYELTKSHLPDGNTTYRLHTYEIAINRFLDSWLWGRWFAAESVDRFSLFEVKSTTQYLPTHSDPLDILANGGLLAAIPFSIGLFLMVYSAWESLKIYWTKKSIDRDPVRGLLAMYFLIVVSGITVMAFNPVLNNAGMGYIYWTCSAVMCALTIEVRRRSMANPSYERLTEGRNGQHR